MPDTRPELDRLCASFEEAIKLLEAALHACPDELWETSMWHVPRTDPWVWPRPGLEPVPERTDEAIQAFSTVATIAGHCLWFLDFYVTADPSGFSTPDYVRGGPEEMPWPADGAAPLHPRAVFPRQVLLRYLDHGRTKLRRRLAGLTHDELEAVCPPGHPHAGKTLRQLLEVNLNHVRGHGGDIAAFLRQRGIELAND
jgi:hypothetical protein